MPGTRIRGLIAAVSLSSITAALACGGPPPKPPSRLFAADSGHFAIGSLIDPNPAAGTVTVDRIIAGANTGLSNNIGSLAFDAANDRLYVGNGITIRVFEQASRAEGNVAPSRVITYASGGGNTGSLFLDTANNRLYVGDDLNGVRVFNNASAINGVAANDRLITLGLGLVQGIAVDTGRNILYVSLRAPSGESGIVVYDGADAVRGNPLPARIIVAHSDQRDFPVAGLFLDAAHDRLYAAGWTFFQVMVFDSVSTADGLTAPTKTLELPNSGSLVTSVFVDVANDRLYAVGANAIAIVPNVSTASGAVAATMVLAPQPFGSFTALVVGP